MISDNDVVDLVFVTPHNFLYAYGMSRQAASDVMRFWWERRQFLFQFHWWKVWQWRAYFEGARWLRQGTFAINNGNPGAVATYATWMIGWEHVLGMYVRPPYAQSAQERMAEIQLRMMEKYEKEEQEGNKWKGEDS